MGERTEDPVSMNEMTKYTISGMFGHLSGARRQVQRLAKNEDGGSERLLSS